MDRAADVFARLVCQRLMTRAECVVALQQSHKCRHTVCWQCRRRVEFFDRRLVHWHEVRRLAAAEAIDAALDRNDALGSPLRVEEVVALFHAG